jgi:membrane associated rhomboid family serine protease
MKEKISSAQTSKNLGEKPAEEMGDIDIIRACGMAGQSNPLGLSIWRWRYAGDQGEVAKIAVSLVVLFYYGSILTGAIPVMRGCGGVSWQGHLTGAIAGVLAAYWLSSPEREARARRKAAPSLPGSPT